jgi:hypothetical protein
VVLEQDLPLKVGDSVTSLSRIGAGTMVRRCSFHACGHVVVKAPDTVVEDCQFAYSSTIALQAGSDIGFWSESGFAENLILRNNRFTHAMTGANALTAGNGALGAIYVGMSYPQKARGFQNRGQPHRRFLRLCDLREQCRRRRDHRQCDRPDFYPRQCL